MIERFFTDTFTVKRQEWLEDDHGEYSALSEIDSFSGHLQQASQEIVERFNMNFQTAYSVWCPVDTDVKIGDHIEDDTRTFTVRGIQKNNIGLNPHLELAVEGGETIES